jgi:hypothetical protein
VNVKGQLLTLFKELAFLFGQSSLKALAFNDEYVLSSMGKGISNFKSFLFVYEEVNFVRQN